MTGAWAGAGYGWRGSWLVAGRAGFGVLLLPGLGSAAPVPRFLGTQPPCETQVLLNYLITKREVVTGKSQTKGEVCDFPVTTERSRLLRCLLFGLLIKEQN